MSDQEQPKSEEQPQKMFGDISSSVTMAFNLGVSANQQAAATKSVVEIANDLGIEIYNNLTQVHGSQFNNDDSIRVNTEFFLQIALMGYIIPNVCVYEEDFKNRLLKLIEAKAKRASSQQHQSKPPDGGSIIVP